MVCIAEFSIHTRECHIEVEVHGLNVRVTIKVIDVELGWIDGSDCLPQNSFAWNSNGAFFFPNGFRDRDKEELEMTYCNTG